jgi:hypothetical protein
MATAIEKLLQAFEGPEKRKTSSQEQFSEAFHWPCKRSDRKQGALCWG